ncbi:serine/threonine-protein kinase [Myxococcus qinghaiensis]|uniref:serine/threonine-protein kinase n=1 Tax=Myxococcus qinghaiensis TaxID=2906758 RepID=UPI0020A6FA7C|nr:serine/threonine-protein kinase [Myxococcus qinghaiensis]MCP3162538.1 serine/threonine-protein kinase [Myxococcus qinghaiensis]
MSSRGEAVEGRCLGENTLDGLSRGLLTSEEREAAARHLDGCDDCRRLLAALGQVVSTPGTATPRPDSARAPLEARPRLVSGDRLGRYTVLHLVGAGGMGVVYAAYDPELDRRVALKLVHDEVLPADSREEAASRLLREAQALARLSHPHVITVFDGGRFDGQVFLAMEFMEGGTLGQWLRAAPRSADEVLAMFLDAGRGLAAAHRAGLVHRDFKPDNVLVGRDGRVRVTDFGLARMALPGEPPLGGAEVAPRALPAGEEARTQTGGRLGTPVYMAPELWRGAPADARSDQFAFCVAFHEALQGERPFTVEQLAGGAGGLEGREPPRAGRIPPHWRRSLARGLSARPEERFPSMAALLDTLESGQASRRKRRLRVLALLGGVGLLAAGFGLFAGRERTQDVCAGARERLAGAWDEARKREVHAAFLATGSPLAQAAWSGTELLVDRYANAWVQMRTDACEATHVRGEQSGELLDLRMACLAQRRESLRALSQVLGAADTGIVEKAAEAAGQLPSLEGCASTEALTAPLRPPQDAATRARIDQVRSRLADAKALLSAGRYAPSLALTESAVEASRALAYKPLEAEALLALGLAHERLTQTPPAEKAFERALVAAEAGGHVEVSARTACMLALVQGLHQRRHAQGHFWEEFCGALLERLGPVPGLTAERLFVLGNLLNDEGHTAEALPVLEEALALQEQVLGLEHPNVARTLGRLAFVLAALERPSEALAHAQRALAIQEKLLGLHHPQCVTSLHAIAFALSVVGGLSDALPHAARALAIEERAFGPKHPAILKSLIILSNVQSEAADAVPLLERALVIHQQSPQGDESDKVFILKNLAVNHGLLGHAAEQLDYARQALAIEEKVLAPDAPELGHSFLLMGQAHVRLGAPAKALPLLERALAIAESRPLTSATASGREVRVELRQVLAETLWALRREHGRARSLVTGALELARGGRGEVVKEVPALERWLSTHPLPN